MVTSFDDVYDTVYTNEELWKNDQGFGLWNNKTFCLLGFNDRIESCKSLVTQILKSLVLRGANVLKYPNKNLDVKKVSITYYLCNYSMGYDTRPPNTLDYKLVTPIWLHSCNRDNRIYTADSLPIFRANRTFNCLKFERTDLKVSLFGSLNDKLASSKTKSSSTIKYSSDTLCRFIAHCGFIYVEPNELKEKNFKHDGRLYLLFCKTFDESIDDNIIDMSLTIPCLSIEWLFDSYLLGELKEIKNYLVSLQRYNTKSQFKKRKNMKRNYTNKVLCFSFGFAVENQLHRVDFNDFGALDAYVVNPVHVLAPWSLDTPDQEAKKMYNNISLVEDSKLLLFISKAECAHECNGLFGELSLLVENCAPKSHKNLVRPLKIYNSLNITVDNLIEVPFELLDGKKLNLFDRNMNVNLYDLADSITFMDVDNLSQYQDEIVGYESTQELHEIIEEFSNGLRESELRWLKMTSEGRV